MFDLGRLRLLRDLAQRGTMTAVAAASRLTPSAVSQQLATLEAEAAVKLFEPVGRRVRLTSAGLRLAAHAQSILDAVEAAQVDMGIAATQPDGRIAIACFGTFAKSHLLPAVVRIRSHHAGLEVIISELEPVDVQTSQRPVATPLQSMLFVVDTVNTRPGTIGAFWISDLRFRKAQ
jgi:DNA-binding transcriptional LysR family regulator